MKLEIAATDRVWDPEGAQQVKAKLFRRAMDNPRSSLAFAEWQWHGQVFPRGKTPVDRVLESGRRDLVPVLFIGLDLSAGTYRELAADHSCIAWVAVDGERPWGPSARKAVRNTGDLQRNLLSV